MSLCFDQSFGRFCAICFFSMKSSKWNEKISKSVSLLQSQLLYCRLNFFTAEWISLLQNQFLYYRFNFFTSESISLLQIEFLHHRINFCTTESISLLQNQFLYCRTIQVASPERGGPFKFKNKQKLKQENNKLDDRKFPCREAGELPGPPRHEVRHSVFVLKSMNLIRKPCLGRSQYPPG